MNYNIVIMGDGQVGKTTYLKKLTTSTGYVPTHGSGVIDLCFNTGTGKATFHVYDDSYPVVIHGVIIMFDLTNFKSFEDVMTHYNQMKLHFVPIILCGNKVDLKNRKVSKEMIGDLIHQIHRPHNFTYFDISSTTGYNLQKPFLHLIRQLRR